MAGLGDELGVAPQAVASRLRRDTETVVGTTLPGTARWSESLINTLCTKDIG